MTISKQVREYKAANPNATNAEVATACKTTALYVYQILHPKKVKKIKKENMLVAPTEGQKVLRKELACLNEQIAYLKGHLKSNELLIDGQENKIQQLENDIVGYRAVISYLQSQLDGLAI
jgi:peptidoglycan hydrolase CwlO-like protein